MKNKSFVTLKLFTVCVLCIAMGISFTACDSIGNDVEQTNNSLTIYDTDGFAFESEFSKSPLLESYKELYPDVELKVVASPEKGREEFEKKMEADILAGKGPDLLYIDSHFYTNNNVEGMMRSGAFADMTPLIKADKRFNYSNYIDAVMKFGVLDEKRYLMPTSFDIPTLLTTQSILDETGFNIDNCKAFWGFTNELTKYYESQTKKDHMGFGYGVSYFKYFYNLADINIIDYTAKKTALDSKEFKMGVDFIKKIYNKTEWYDENYNTIEAHNYLINCKKLFSDYPFIDTPKTFGAEIQGGLLMNNEKPVILPIRDKNGKIQASFRFGVAINNSSPNKQNAYNFMKLILDIRQPDVSSIPVSKKEIKELDTYVPKGNSKVNTDFLKDIDLIRATTRSDVILSEKMLPYYKGEKAYEECIKEAKEYIELYLSE